MIAEKSEALSFEEEEFKSSNAGILVFLPCLSDMASMGSLADQPTLLLLKSVNYPPSFAL